MNLADSGPPDWFERLATRISVVETSPFARFVAPDDASARHSAVLVLFGPGSTDRGPDLLLTERSAQLRAHAGQVAFPGGRVDPEDAGPAAAALREAVEETGLDPAGVRIRAVGPELYLSVTNYLVTPVLAWWHRPSPVSPGDPAEVTRVVQVPVADLIDPSNRFQTVHPSGFVSPGFAAADLFIWGFTAGVLSWLIAQAGLEKPWDGERRRPTPPQPPPGQSLAQELTEQLDERVIE